MPRGVHGNHARGKRSGSWRGGRRIQKGYVQLRVGTEYKFEHVLIAEAALGRALAPENEVHHFNEIKTDNRNRNLVICQDGAYHQLLHRRARAYRATGNPSALKCVRCSVWILPGDPELRVFKSRPACAYHASCERKRGAKRYRGLMETI